jgi:hypothetical protein
LVSKGADFTTSSLANSFSLAGGVLPVVAEVFLDGGVVLIEAGFFFAEIDAAL